jgi:GMP synthase (glutamine-hydrolysing)
MGGSMTNRSVLILRHHDADGPGTIARVLAAREVPVREVRTYKEDPLPTSLAGVGALVVLGGPMSVGECSREELGLVASAVREAVPVLGVCLGAQLLAVALGGEVVRARSPEIGWEPVELVDTAPLVSVIPPTFTPFHWHSDAIALPRGATLLARSYATPVQAFCRGSAYGLQFHLEVDASGIEAMQTAYAAELRAASVDVRALADDTRRYLAQQERIASVFFGAWADRYVRRA